MPASDITIEDLRSVDETHVLGLAPLIAQLSTSSPSPDLAHLRRVVANPDASLFFARDASGTVVGALYFVMFAIPTGLRALIEDVVVDVSVRGQGVASMLMKSAIETARSAGVLTIDLTSRPSREAANRLYEHLGFQKRETNVWRYNLASDS